MTTAIALRALRVDCPRCGVSPGERCQATHPKHGLLYRPDIKHPHRERIAEARKMATDAPLTAGEVACALKEGADVRRAAERTLKRSPRR